MPRFYRICFFFLCLVLPGVAFAAEKPAARQEESVAAARVWARDFSFHRLGPGNGPTMLVVGGIQGDEPGGFSAAALLVTNYTIASGSLWVVPNLNFPSIVERNRGSFGDMNRKFAFMDAQDPDFTVVRRIQEIILSPEVDLVLNLHDGSGFYRPLWENATRNPQRWGQSIIIDQERMDAAGSKYPRLADMANQAITDGNKFLLAAEHKYHLRNTYTAKGNQEMEKTLTWFAVRNGKAAFGVEASKEFTTEYRSYYHIHMLESFMRQMGILFTRDFPLTPRGIRTAINSNVQVALYKNRVVLPLDNARPQQAGYLPFKKGASLEPAYTKPLLAMLPDAAGLRVAYGNRTLTRFIPEYMEYDESLSSIEVEQDGRVRRVNIGEVLAVKDTFAVRQVTGYRVNAIGAPKGKGYNVTLRKTDFTPRYSVDKNGTTYRVELYKDNAFAGMVLVRFGAAAPAAGEVITARQGAESTLGF